MLTRRQRLDLVHAYHLLRSEQKLSAQEVAASVGISTSLYSKIENGWRQPTPTQRLALAKVLKIKPRELPTAVDVPA